MEKPTSNQSLETLDKVRVLYRQGKYEACLSTVREFSQHPEHKTYLEEFLELAGRSQFHLGYLDLALTNFLKLQDLNPNYPKINFRIALSYDEKRDFKNAMDFYKKELSINANHLPSLYNSARLMLFYNETKIAESVYRYIISIEKNATEAYLNLTQCKHFENVAEQETADLLQISLDPTLSVQQKIESSFALGKMFDDLNDYDRSFTYYLHGNTLAYSKKNFDFEDESRYVAAIEKAYSAKLPTSREQTALQPIFLIGLPRSGKTQTERLINLSIHAKPCSEAKVISNLAATMHHLKKTRAEFPISQSQLTEADLGEFTHSIAKKYQDLPGTDSLIILDTTPNYYLYLGLIHQIFPEAKIIHCLRDPLDHCLQMYFKYFSKGHAYSYDLASLGHFYKLFTQMMAFWHKSQDINVLEVRYEDLVTDPQTHQQKIMKFLGVKEFNPVPSGVFNSLEKGRAAHYLQHLEPIRRILKL